MLSQSQNVFNMHQACMIHIHCTKYENNWSRHLCIILNRYQNQTKKSTIAIYWHRASLCYVQDKSWWYLITVPCPGGISSLYHVWRISAKGFLNHDKVVKIIWKMAIITSKLIHCNATRQRNGLVLSSLV